MYNIDTNCCVCVYVVNANNTYTHTNTVNYINALISKTCYANTIIFAGTHNLISASNLWLDICFCCLQQIIGNDPSAGSPTETLLRLLPGSSHCDKGGFHQSESPPVARLQNSSPRFSRNGSVPGSDGRCVQRAGT